MPSRVRLTRRQPENRKFAQSSYVAPQGGGGGGSGTLDWFSDFRNGTGFGATAVHDGTGANAKWGGESGNNYGTNKLQVIAATGLGFPAGMTNVLEAVLDTTSISAMIRTGKGKWTSPTVGTTPYMYLRWHQRCDYPNSNTGYDPGGLGNHPVMADNIIGDGGPGELKWEFHIDDVSGGNLTFIADYNPQQGVKRYQLSNSGGAVMARTSVYCIEQRLQRTASATAKADLRITNSSGALIATSANYISVNSPFGSLAADNPDIDLGSDPDAQFQTITFGNNGPSGTRNTSASVYYGGMAVRISSSSTDWIGPYPISGVES